jgi:hypothetical protein
VVVRPPGRKLNYWEPPQNSLARASAVQAVCAQRLAKPARAEGSTSDKFCSCWSTWRLMPGTLFPEAAPSRLPRGQCLIVHPGTHRACNHRPELTDRRHRARKGTSTTSAIPPQATSAAASGHPFRKADGQSGRCGRSWPLHAAEVACGGIAEVVEVLFLAQWRMSIRRFFSIECHEIRCASFDVARELPTSDTPTDRMQLPPHFVETAVSK